jgi:bifunctional UDP-N-acetylglucosamine pyrophosphorylase/glucosamine-1-phosphate N-acetyltransferase
MKSPLPKVLHPVGGRAMLDHAIDAAEALGCERIIVVVGNHSPEVRAHVVKRLGEAAIAVQDPPIGTGHAVRAAEAAMAGFTGLGGSPFCPIRRRQCPSPPPAEVL